MNGRQMITSCLVVGCLMGGQAEGRGESTAAECHRRLAAAREQERHQGSTEETKELYRHAFAECPEAGDLPLDIGARLEARRGGFVLVYDGDPRRAVEVFEEALEWVTAEGGADHPARIELLEGLARALHAAALRDDAEKGLRDRQRSEGAYAEALRVRRAAYGDESVEAARGLLLVAASHLAEQPATAETYAREALATSERVAGPIHPSVFESLVMVESALREQGRSAEADEVRERIAHVLHELEERGIPLDGEG